MPAFPEKLRAALRLRLRFLQALVHDYQQAGCRDSAAALTYTTLFALVPMLTVVFAILRSMPALADSGSQFEALIFENFLPETGAQVRDYLTAFAGKAGSLTAIGAVILFVTSVMMLVTIERAFNRIWHIHRQRGLVSSLLVYWTVLTLGPLLIGAGLALTSYLVSSDLFHAAVGNTETFRRLLGLLPFVLSAAGFSILYIAVPNCNVPIREGIAGGIVAAALFELAKKGFSLFVTGFSSYNLVYGAFAAVPVFLLWIYLSWMITLFGVVLVYVLVNWDEEEVRAGSLLPGLLQVLALFRARQRQGDSVADREARRCASAAGIENWNDLREVLLASNLLQRTQSGELMLARDLDDMRLRDIVRLLPWSGLDVPADADAPATVALREALQAFDARLDQTLAGAIDDMNAARPRGE
jgi:membrane protein